MNFSVGETEDKVFKNTWVSYLIISQEAAERTKKIDSNGSRHQALSLELMRLFIIEREWHSD